MAKFTKIFIGTVAAIGISHALFADSDKTMFQAEIINNTGESLYVTKGALPDAGHLHRSNRMFCPIFAAKQAVKQQLVWKLAPSLYPKTGESLGVLLHFYQANGNPDSTPIASQTDYCQAAVCGIPGKPACSSSTKFPSHIGPKDSTALTCVQGSVLKYGGIKLAGYNPGIVTISKVPGGLKCDLNPYVYTVQDVPYRQINVGQNYLPPIGHNLKGVRPTLDTPIINLRAYLMNYNASLPLPIVYMVNGLSAQLINLPTASDFSNIKPGPHPDALLQLKKGGIFVQHNIGAPNASMPAGKVTLNTFDALKAKFCNKSDPGFCTPYLLDPKTGRSDPNKFVLWPSVSAVMQVYPAKTAQPSLSPSSGHSLLPACHTGNYNSQGQCMGEITFPIVISNALRAKNVSEFVKPRMLWLMQNNKIQEDAKGNPYASWQNKNAPNQLWPDGADQFTADPKDYLAVSVNANDFAAAAQNPVSISLGKYFVPPHFQKPSLSYSLDSSYLQVSQANKNIYSGASTGILQSNPVVKPRSTIDAAPIVRINGINQVTPVTCSADANGVCTQAGPFKIVNGALIIQSNPAPGVYQVNVKATDASGGDAFNTFYVYASKSGTSFLQWQQGALPSFNVLSYQPGKKFGTAYLYTSYDFTKDYSRPLWVKSIGTLIGDIGKANTNYKTNIQDAFVDVNNLSFKGLKGYWPIEPGVKGYKSGYVAGVIQSGQMVTNLAGTIGCEANNTCMLPNLQTALGKVAGQGNNPYVALTVYPSNNLKANFAGFNEQQRQIFADMSAIPALSSTENKGYINGISVDLEGGLNSVGDVQFYKLLADKLAYHGKWFSYFYFVTVASPAFAEALGPLGALEVSTYDVGTFRTPTGGKLAVQMESPTGNIYPQTIIPGTTPIQSAPSSANPIVIGGGWKTKDVTNLYTAFGNDRRCNEIDFPSGKTGSYTLKIHSWCNNSHDMSYSENHRLWTSLVAANGLQYGTPVENLEFFNGKFHLVLPVSWSATQFTNSILLNPDLTPPGAGGKWNEGLFMQNSSSKISGCVDNPSVKDATSCLFGDLMVGGVPVQDISSEPDLTAAKVPHLVISNLPGSAKGQNNNWLDVGRYGQEHYLYTNYGLFEDLNSNLKANNLVGIGAYALENYENVPATVAANAQGIPGSPTNTAMQIPWYIGFSPDGIVGTKPGANAPAGATGLVPGYSIDQVNAVWSGFKALATQIGQASTS